MRVAKYIRQYWPVDRDRASTGQASTGQKYHVNLDRATGQLAPRQVRKLGGGGRSPLDRSPAHPDPSINRANTCNQARLDQPGPLLILGVIYWKLKIVQALPINDH